MRNRLTWLRAIAGTKDQYPTAEKLLDLLHGEIAHSRRPGEAWEALSAFLDGMARADVQGLISTANEHEWAYLSLRAQERAAEEHNDFVRHSGTLFSHDTTQRLVIKPQDGEKP